MTESVQWKIASEPRDCFSVKNIFIKGKFQINSICNIIVHFNELSLRLFKLNYDSDAGVDLICYFHPFHF